MSRITRLLTDSSRLQRRGGPTRGRLAAGTAVLALGFSMTLAWARPADPPRSKIVASAQMEMLETLSDALKRSVADGEISKEAAMAMYLQFADAIELAIPKGESVSDDDRLEALQERYEAVEDMLEAGKISPEKAEAMFGRLETAMKMALNDNDKKKTPTIEQIQERHEAVEGMLEDSLDRTLAEIEAKVRSGAIGRDEAARWVRAIQLANTIVEIEDSVKDGDLPRSEADAIYRELGIK